MTEVYAATAASTRDATFKREAMDMSGRERKGEMWEKVTALKVKLKLA